MSRLYLMLGAHSSGKTTYATAYARYLQEENRTSALLISTDEILKELKMLERSDTSVDVMRIVKKRASEYIKSGFDVIIDPSYLSVGDIRTLLDAIRGSVGSNAMETVGILMDVSLEFCIYANSQKEEPKTDETVRETWEWSQNSRCFYHSLFDEYYEFFIGCKEPKEKADEFVKISWSGTDRDTR